MMQHNHLTIRASQISTSSDIYVCFWGKADIYITRCANLLGPDGQVVMLYHVIYFMSCDLICVVSSILACCTFYLSYKYIYIALSYQAHGKLESHWAISNIY